MATITLSKKDEQIQKKHSSFSFVYTIVLFVPESSY